MTVQKRVALLLGGLVFVAILAGCITFNPGYRLPTPVPQTPATFTADLIAALVNRDVAVLRGMMSDPFIVAIWQGEASEQPESAAIDQLESDLIGPASSITFVSNEVVRSWLGGMDPLTLWPEEMTAVSSVGMSGLGAESRGEAILIVAQGADGAYSWQAALIADDGFAAAGGAPAQPIVIVPGQPPLTFLPSDVTQVLVLGTIGIFDAPSSTFTQIGLAFRGETYAALGVSADGQWWAVRCSFSDLPCWIGANPTFVRPVNLSPASKPTQRPTTTPRPTATPVQPIYPTRIELASGQGSVVVSGDIGPGYTVQYVLFVRGDQTLRLLVDSPSPSTEFSVHGVSDGVTYKARSVLQREWSMVLPRTQDYLITLSATVRTSYLLEVTVSQSPPLAPERIQFGTGETSAVRSGALPISQVKEYIFRAQAGQETRVLLSSPGGAVNFLLQGVNDGVVYKPFSNPAREFGMTLPSTQDYLITLNGPAAINYTLELIVQPLGATSTPTSPPAMPERIQFGAGETSVVRSGSLPASQIKQYIFRAQGGQQSRILLNSPGSAANFALQGVNDGVVYKPFGNPAREFGLTLPSTQDYLISINGPAFIDYLLELTVLPLGPTPVPTAAAERIHFGPGETSAVRSGPLYANTPRQYIFGASAGQATRVLLSSLSPAANFSVRGVSDGVQYKSMVDPLREWLFTLPASQDYLITIQAPVNTSFTLELIILPPAPPTTTPTATALPTTPPTATTAPTATPTATATATATLEPTATEAPTLEPTATEAPTLEPTATEAPTLEPTETAVP